MNKLFLDDERKPSDVKWVVMPLGPWDTVRNYKEFVDHISKNGLPPFVSFDHDLAVEHYRASMYNSDRHYNNYYTDGTFKEMTGYQCAKWLIEYCIEKKQKFPSYQIHTMNPIGRENIQTIIQSAKRVHEFL